MTDPGLQRFGELSSLELRRVDAVMEQRNRGEKGGDREHGGQ